MAMFNSYVCLAEGKFADAKVAAAEVRRPRAPSTSMICRVCGSWLSPALRRVVDPVDRWLMDYTMDLRYMYM
jgi:hypothetical protein